MRLTQHTEFSGNASELADLAVACSRGLRLALGTDKTNERLARYYVTEGVLDRPERVGRDAAYGYRHLLQLLTARRMADAGIALAAVYPRRVDRLEAQGHIGAVEGERLRLEGSIVAHLENIERNDGFQPRGHRQRAAQAGSAGVSGFALNHLVVRGRDERSPAPW